MPFNLGLLFNTYAKAQEKAKQMDRETEDLNRKDQEYADEVAYKKAQVDLQKNQQKITSDQNKIENAFRAQQGMNDTLRTTNSVLNDVSERTRQYNEQQAKNFATQKSKAEEVYTVLQNSGLGSREEMAALYGTMMNKLSSSTDAAPIPYQAFNFLQAHKTTPSYMNGTDAYKNSVDTALMNLGIGTGKSKSVMVDGKEVFATSEKEYAELIEKDATIKKIKSETQKNEAEAEKTKKEAGIEEEGGYSEDSSSGSKSKGKGKDKKTSNSSFLSNEEVGTLYDNGVITGEDMSSVMSLPKEIQKQIKIMLGALGEPVDVTEKMVEKDPSLESYLGQKIYNPEKVKAIKTRVEKEIKSVKDKEANDFVFGVKNSFDDMGPKLYNNLIQLRPDLASIDKQIVSKALMDSYSYLASDRKRTSPLNFDTISGEPNKLDVEYVVKEAADKLDKKITPEFEEARSMIAGSKKMTAIQARVFMEELSNAARKSGLRVPIESNGIVKVFFIDTDGIWHLEMDGTPEPKQNEPEIKKTQQTKAPKSLGGFF